MTNDIPVPDSLSTPLSENVDTSMNPGNSIPDESAVNALMLEEGLDRDTATVISQIDTRLKTYDANFLTYEQTFSDQSTWDVQIRAIPDQVYVPTEAELETAALTGRQIYNASYAFEEIDGVPQLTLSYFVPYDVMSEELKASIQSSSPETSAAMAGLLPAADASGGASGAVIQAIVKRLAQEGLNKLVGTDLGTIFAALDVAAGEYKAGQSRSYFSELDHLRACAENPTNLLTKKTYQENPSEKAKVIDQIDEAQTQVQQLAAARLLNLAAKTGAKFTGVNLAGKLFFDSVAKWNDETLKEVSERWVDDAKKAVVSCEPAAISLDGTIQYKVTRSFEYKDEYCDSYAACYQEEEQQSGSGTFSVTTRGDGIIGNGTGTYAGTRTKTITQSPSHPLTEYNGEFNFVISGDVVIKVEGAQSPTVRLTVNGGGYLTEDGSSTNYIADYGDSKVKPVTEEIHRETTGGFACHFEGVDLVKGGKYVEIITLGDAVGTCEIELLPRTPQED